jgi:membrane associated rhomboid family serine protease
MNNITRILFFFVLPLIAVLSYPPEIFLSSSEWRLSITIRGSCFRSLGIMLYRGSSRALTLSIFIQGLNVIIRIMMFFPHSVPRPGEFNWTYIIFSILGLALSSYLMLRLDRADIRSRLVT